MIEVLSIYVVAIGTLLAAGVSVTAVASPTGKWFGTTTLPLGAGILVLLLYPLGYFFPTRVATWIVVGSLLSALAFGVARRKQLRRHDPTITACREALKPSRTELSTLAWGVAAGGVFLWPLLRMDLSTTAAVSVFDGWSRAVFAEWVYRNPTGSAELVTSATRPLGAYSAPPDALAMGLEHLSALMMTITGQPSFKVVSIVAALSAPIAASGLALLTCRLGGTVTSLKAPLFALAAIVPPAAFLFADNYFTQLLSVSLVPFAAASALGFGRHMTVQRLVIAVVAMTAVLGIYPPMAPWLAPVVVVSYIIGIRQGTPRGFRATLAATAALLTTLVVMAPLQVYRTFSSISTVSGLKSNEGFPLFGPFDQAEIALGGRTPFSLTPFALPGEVMPAAIVLVVVAVAAGTAIALTRRSTDAIVVSALFVAVAAPTLVLAWRYGFIDGYGYGVTKAVASGTSLLLGMIVVGLCLPARSDSATLSRTTLAAACALLWLPVSLQTTNLVTDRGVGFRERDLEAHDQLRDLPQDVPVLFEGVSRSLLPFQTRAITAYFESYYPHVNLMGQGTAPTYMTEGGAPTWRPEAPWEFVITSEPTFVATRRHVVWSNEAYVLTRAPLLDVTPYGSGWRNVGFDESDRPLGIGTGEVQLVASNRSNSRQRVRIQVRVSNTEAVRTVLKLTFGRTSRSFVLEAGSSRSVSIGGAIDARSTAVVSMMPEGAARPNDGVVAPQGASRLEYDTVTVSRVRR